MQEHPGAGCATSGFSGSQPAQAAPSLSSSSTPHNMQAEQPAAPTSHSGLISDTMRMYSLVVSTAGGTGGSTGGGVIWHDVW